jgi:hypothetical protein
MYKHLRTHVHGRVLTQLAIIGVVGVGLLAAVAYDALAGQIGLGLVAIGLIVGLIIGFAIGRIFKLAWHEDTRQVIMNLDKMSFVLIGVYIAFRVFGDELLKHYIQGSALSALTFALLSGILLGRLFSVWGGVRRILKAQGII